MRNIATLMGVALTAALLTFGQAAKKSSAVKKSGPAKAKTSTASKKKTTSKKQTAAKQTPVRRSVQQQPTPERYKEIQKALADKGYFGGDVDGNWGPSSVDALKRFQHDQNLNEDGKLGALSVIALGLGPKHTPPQ